MQQPENRLKSAKIEELVNLEVKALFWPLFFLGSYKNPKFYPAPTAPVVAPNARDSGPIQPEAKAALQ